MRLAPELPTTETLEGMHPLSGEGIGKITEKRLEAAKALRFGNTLLAIVGPCAMTDDAEKIIDENKQITDFGKEQGIMTLHRLPPWKPRTNPDDWHGLETTDPVTAHRITTEIAEQSGNLALEIGHTSQVKRNLARAAFSWRGSRNDGDKELLHALNASDPLLPIALKNGMDGHVERAQHDVDALSARRDAPSVLLFRGGSDFSTKEKWFQQYLHAHELTDGNLIVDAAHGGEQAHDPNGKFSKSAIGQLACMQSIIHIAETTGKLPRGVMIEASDIDSPTDPVVPLDDASEALQQLAVVHSQITVESDTAVAAD